MAALESWDDLSELSRGFMAARVIIAATELELFDHLEEGGATAEEVAAHYGGTPRAFGIILNALAALGVIAKQGDRYRNTPLGERHLVTTSPHYLGDGVRLRLHLWESWSHLEAILRGESVERPELLEDPERNRRFTRAMHAYHFDEAREIAPLLGLDGAPAILDLGGGAGSYAIAFCLASPQCRVVLIDRPQTLETARQYVDEHGLSGRITLQAGDFYGDADCDLGGPYDLVFISHVLHIEDEEHNLALLRRVVEATQPGGRIVINEVPIQDNRIEPVWGAVFAVNMLAVTERGNSYPQSTLEAWLKAAGCASVDFLTEAITVGHKGP
ncbi:MAG: methyltransferase [Candidatus Tectimicrobiota bacterium]